MDISTKLKLKRKELDLTQQQVADKIFVTRQTISKWELGKSEPDLISLTLLNNLLDLDSLEEDKIHSSKGVFRMNLKLSFKDIIFTLLFGIIFLPVRILYSLSQQHKDSKILKFLVKPVLFVLFLLYVRSLILKAFILVIAVTLFFYYLVTIYYSENQLIK